MDLNKNFIIDETFKIVVDATKILDLKGNIDIQEKDGIGNIVTEIDIKLENFLKDELNKVFPDSLIIAEESAKETDFTSDLKFVIDPLDGSTNFVNEWPHAIAVGIIYKNALISGILYDAASREIIYSILDEGVFKFSLDDLNNKVKMVKPKYNKSNIKKAVIAHDNPYGEEALEKTVVMYKNIVKNGGSTKICGPISLDIVKTALGKENRPYEYYDAVWHMEVRAWDLCAATAILRELGGDIIDINGNSLKVDTLSNPVKKIGFIAAGNSELIINLYSIYRRCNL